MNSIEPPPTILIHGLMGSSQGAKARHLRGIFPGIVCPDFTGTLDERMAELEGIMPAGQPWKVVGSSLGGLMAAIYACSHPERVERMVLLAPALIWPDFKRALPEPVSVPTVIYHGLHDTIIPLDEMRTIAEKIFTNLILNVVEDDHSLNDTVAAVDWRELLDSP